MPDSSTDWNGEQIERVGFKNTLVPTNTDCPLLGLGVPYRTIPERGRK